MILNKSVFLLYPLNCFFGNIWAVATWEQTHTCRLLSVLYSPKQGLHAEKERHTAGLIIKISHGYMEKKVDCIIMGVV